VFERTSPKKKFDFKTWSTPYCYSCQEDKEETASDFFHWFLFVIASVQTITSPVKESSRLVVVGAFASKALSTAGVSPYIREDFISPW
jgi:hypothetical protein